MFGGFHWRKKCHLWFLRCLPFWAHCWFWLSRFLSFASHFSFQPLKMARYSFSGPIPPKFEHKLRHHKQSFGKIATTVVLDKDENLSWSGLQRHRSCHSNKMTLLPILLVAVYLGTENCSSKIVHGSFFLQ